jgi:hypothetical protein
MILNVDTIVTMIVSVVVNEALRHRRWPYAAMGPQWRQRAKPRDIETILAVIAVKSTSTLSFAADIHCQWTTTA